MGDDGVGFLVIEWDYCVIGYILLQQFFNIFQREK